MVEFDLTDRELPELDVEAFEELEPVDEPEPEPAHAEQGPVRTLPVPTAPPVVPRQHGAEAWTLPLYAQELPLELAPPPSPLVLLARMTLAFVGAMFVTAGVLLVAYFALIAPQIDSARLARRGLGGVVAVPASTPTLPVEGVVDAARPTVPGVKVETAPAADTPPSEGDEPTEGDPEADASAEPDEPPVVAQEVARPPTVPTRTAPARPAPVRRPVPQPRVVGRVPVEPPPEPAAPAEVATPKPKPAPAAAPAPPALAPVKARALAGNLSGTASGASVVLAVRFLAEGRMTGSVTRDGTRRSASGSYQMDGNAARIVFVASGGNTYTGTVNATGATGRFTGPDGSKGRFKVRR